MIGSSYNDHIIDGSDCELPVKKLCIKGSDFLPMEYLIGSQREVIAGSTCIDIQYLNRKNNVLAHMLA